MFHKDVIALLKQTYFGSDKSEVTADNWRPSLVQQVKAGALLTALLTKNGTSTNVVWCVMCDLYICGANTVPSF